LSVVAPAGIGLLVGAGVGILLGRTWLAPKPPAATRLNPGGGLKDVSWEKGAFDSDAANTKGVWSMSPAGTPKVWEAGVGDVDTKTGLGGGAAAEQEAQRQLTLAAWRARQAVAAAQADVDAAQQEVNDLRPVCEGLMQSVQSTNAHYRSFRTQPQLPTDESAWAGYLRWLRITSAWNSYFQDHPGCLQLEQACERLAAAQQRLAAAQRDLADAEARVGSSATADAARQRELAAQLEFARAQAELARQREAAQGGPRPPPETPVPNVILTDFDACQRAFAALTIAQQGRVADEMLRYFGFSGYVQVEGDAALGARLREVSQAARAKVGSTTLQPKMVNARLRALRVALSAAGQDRRDAFCQLVADAPRTFKPGGALDPLSMSFPLRR